MSKALNLEAILKGLYALFAADAVLKAKVNYSTNFVGFYQLQPKHGAPFPYIIAAPLSVEPWDCLGADGATGEYFYYQLSVFSTGFPDPRQSLDIVKELTRVFDEAEVAISGYATVRNERLGSALPVPQPDKNIFHAPVRYRLFLEFS